MSGARPSLENHRRWLDSRWLVPVVLAVPFVVMIAALRGLTVTLPIFHSTDEGNYIYPTIRQFARQLPFPDVGHYVAAQTPLFPLLEAYVGKLIGYALWKMRLVEVWISYLLALAVYFLLERRMRLQRLQALVLSVLFVLSPYVFGTSFRAITDNLATLFIVLALERFERFRETRRIGPFLAGCGAVAGATLTRQSAAFMLAVGGLYALWVALPLLRRAEPVRASTGRAGRRVPR
jgi:4-amino-4-deoxy-L-arabinose transferase-like glycosyltransferase